MECVEVGEKGGVIGFLRIDVLGHRIAAGIPCRWGKRRSDVSAIVIVALRIVLVGVLLLIGCMRLRRREKIGYAFRFGSSRRSSPARSAYVSSSSRRARGRRILLSQYPGEVEVIASLPDHAKVL